MRWLGALLTLCLSGCASDLQSHISFEELDADILFILTEDISTKEFTAFSPNARSPDDFAGEPLAQFILDISKQQSHILGINLDVLSAKFSIFDRERATRTLLRRKTDSPPPLEFAVFPVAKDFLHLRIENRDNKTQAATEEQIERVVNEFELLLPRNYDACRTPEHETFKRVPFPKRDECPRGWDSLEPIDENRVLAVSGQLIQIFDLRTLADCGQTPEQSSSNRGTIAAAPANGNNVAVGSKPLPNGARLVVTVENSPPAKNAERIIITERHLFENGFGPVTYSETILTEDVRNVVSKDAPYATDVFIDEANRVYITTLKGTVLSRTEDESNYQQYPVTAFEENLRDSDSWLVRKIEQGTPQHIISTYENIYLGNLFEDTWQKIELGGFEALLNAWDIAVGEKIGEAGFYAVANDGSKGWLLQYKNEEISELPIRFPKRVAGCFTPAGHFNNLRRIGIDKNATYLVSHCSAVTRIRRSDECVSFINYSNEPTYTVGPSYLISDLVVQEDRLIVSSTDGYLYTYDLTLIP